MSSSNQSRQPSYTARAKNIIRTRGNGRRGRPPVYPKFIDNRR